jgi:hypothetical protein
MDTALLELVKFLKEASPLVWEAAIRQVYVVGFAGLAGGLFLLFLSVICAVLYWRMEAATNAYHKALENVPPGKNYFERRASVEGNIPLLVKLRKADAQIPAVSVSLVSAVLSVALLVSGTMYLSNPNWYAISFLLEALTGK